MYDIAVDIGGTFTDCVIHDAERELVMAAKAPSRRDNLGGGVLDSVRAAAERLEVPLEDVLGKTRRFIHGSTVATNAMIERDGARTAYVTTAGHEDTLAIGKIFQKRAGLSEREISHLNQLQMADPPLVARELVFGVRERSRGARSPLSAPTWIHTGDGPGWAEMTCLAASKAAAATSEPSSSSICTASSGVTSSRGRALSRKIGGSSSSRSLPLTRPTTSTTASCRSTSLCFCHASPKASTVAVPLKSSTVIFPHSELSRREICRATAVTTQGSATRRPGRSTSVSEATGSYARTTSRNRSSG